MDSVFALERKIDFPFPPILFSSPDREKNTHGKADNQTKKLLRVPIGGVCFPFVPKKKKRSFPGGKICPGAIPPPSPPIPESIINETPHEDRTNGARIRSSGFTFLIGAWGFEGSECVLCMHGSDVYLAAPVEEKPWRGV